MASTAAHENPPHEKRDASDGTSIEEQIDQLRDVTGEMVRAGDAGRAVTMLLEIISEQHHDIARLAKYNAALLRARYGRRSEKLGADELKQLALALGATEEDAAQAEPQTPQPEESEEEGTDDESEKKKKRRKGSKKGRHPGRSRLDPKLPRNVTFHPVPDDKRNCIHCHNVMRNVGHVDHERVQYIPARIEVDVDRCEKIACRNCKQDIVVAPRPDKIAVERQSTTSGQTSTTTCDVEQNPAQAVAPALHAGEATNQTTTTVATDHSKTEERVDFAPGAHVRRRAGASLLAHLLEAKADDALPIYRQRQQLARLGFDVPLNTLYGYWDAAARIVQPVAQVVLSEVLGQDIVGLDDTRLDWLDPKARGKRQRGHLWCFMGTSPLVAFEFTETWCADDVAPWIENIDGFIQCDDYGGYSAMRKRADGTVTPLVPPDKRLGCWMHTRRPFHTAFKAGERHAILGLAHIKEIYAIEQEAREKQMTPHERLELRQTRSKPIGEEFFTWIHKQEGRVRPSSYLGKAVGYALKQKDFVMRCFDDGRFELDTGRVERQIREPVIGRKNYLFSGSPEAAKRLAGVYSVVCSCMNLGINTRAYLVDIITRLQAGFPLRHINRLRPDIWAQEHPSLTAHQMAQKTAK
jgi:transposase